MSEGNKMNYCSGGYPAHWQPTRNPVVSGLSSSQALPASSALLILSPLLEQWSGVHASFTPELGFVLGVPCALLPSPSRDNHVTTFYLRLRLTDTSQKRLFSSYFLNHAFFSHDPALSSCTNLFIGLFLCISPARMWTVWVKEPCLWVYKEEGVNWQIAYWKH